MKATFSWTFGNFNVAAESEVPEALVKDILGLGLGQLLQRTPSTKAEFRLAEDLGVTKTWEVGEKSGKPIRPKGFQRNSLAYSTENAEVLRQGFGTQVEVADGMNLPFTIVSISQNEGGGESAMVRATNFVLDLLAKGESGRELLQQVLNLTKGENVDGDTSTDDLIALCHKHGIGQGGTGKKGK